MTITMVSESELDPGNVHSSFSGFREDDFEGYLFRSADFGETWWSISGNLPSESVLETTSW